MIKNVPTPAMRQEAATTGSCTMNIFSFSITAISLTLDKFLVYSLSGFWKKMDSKVDPRLSSSTLVKTDSLSGIGRVG